MLTAGQPKRFHLPFEDRGERHERKITEDWMKRVAVVIVASVIGAGVVARADFWDTRANNDNSFRSKNELIHGLSQLHDLAVLAGSEPDMDFYPIKLLSASSYEAVVDGQTGDINVNGVRFARRGFDGTTVLQQSVPADGMTFVRSIRWENDVVTGTTWNYIVVGPALCGASCTISDQYRIRFFETTIGVARYNNSATQQTILFIQNTGIADVSGHVWFWTEAGERAASATFDVAPKGVKVIDTSTVAPGSAGSITISNNGRYGQLAVKAVALEQSTGFTFDTPGFYKPH
jgi:hypothetical protein